MKASKIPIRTITILGVILIVMSLLITLWLAFFRWMSEVESQVYQSYPTLSAAAEEGVIGDYKMLPPFLPPSTNDIRYIVWIETFAEWLTFNFDPGEISKIRNSCIRVTEGDIELASAPPLNLIAWPPGNVEWPDEITAGDTPVRVEDIADYEFYRCKHGLDETTLAVNAEKGKAYYWTHEQPRAEDGESAERVFHHKSYPTYRAAADANAAGECRDLPAFIRHPRAICSICNLQGVLQAWTCGSHSISKSGILSRSASSAIGLSRAKFGLHCHRGISSIGPKEIIPEKINSTVRTEDIPGYEFYRC